MAEVEKRVRYKNNIVRHTRRMKKGPRFAVAAPFIAAVLLLCAAGFLIPLRPTFSEREKRELTKFPEFSVKALLSGDYFDDITAWYADTFPGRESWIELSAKTERLHGSKSVAIYGQTGSAQQIPQAEEIPTVTQRPESTNQPDASPSVSPTPVPTPSPTPVPTPEPTPPETDANGNIIDPEAEGSGTIGIEDAKAEKLNAIAVINGAGYEYFGFIQGPVDTYVIGVNDAAAQAKYENPDVRVFDIVVPNSMGVMLSTELIESLGSSDQNQTINYVCSTLSNDVIGVNIYDNMVKHNGEYIYFRSDHHWTGLGAWYGYESFCEAAGFEPVKLTEYDAYTYDNFLGTFYSSSHDSQMEANPDYVTAYEPKADVHVTAIDTQGVTQDLGNVVYDVTSSGWKYNAFLGGDWRELVITNNDIPGDSSCLVIKESYGNAFAPFLCQHYHEVHVVDYRYVNKTTAWYVAAWGIDDVIYVNNISVLQADERLLEIYHMAHPPY